MICGINGRDKRGGGYHVGLSLAALWCICSIPLGGEVGRSAGVEFR